jgi:G3E family GTPase
MGPDGRPAAIPGPVPALLVAGIDAAQRAQALRTLLSRRPPHQRWAVITSGLGSLELPDGSPQVETAFVAPGCLCCTGLLTFRVGLVRLLRRMAAPPPALLLIDAGTSVHHERMLAELQGPQFAALIRLGEAEA